MKFKYEIERYLAVFGDVSTRDFILEGNAIIYIL